ncbi:MAG: proliferating cell nuclear antigen (pcna) [Candidatus Diapherotrites archaeon]|nr:proliferating cell nuclear antigen (pcna) [Candidatus Diapherotrites archaeon]
MKLILKDGMVFRRCIEAVSVLIDEAELVVGKNGLELRATDPSQISMVDFSLPKSAFEKFDSDDIKLGLDLDYFNRILSRVQSGEKLELALDEKKAHIIVSFKGTGDKSFQVPLIDISSSEVPNPKIDFDAEIKASASLLQSSFKDAALISTHVTLGVTEKKFFVKATSSKGNLNEETPQNKETLPEMKVKRECKSMFPLDYLQDMLKAADSENPVSVFLKTNAPVKISYPIGNASITYFLAPRIESQ